MAWKLLKTQATRHQFRNRLCYSQKRFQSSFLSNLSRRLRGGAHETTTEVAQKNDLEAVIREFESQSSRHANPAAISEYVKALIKLDKLDQSQFLLDTFRKGGSCSQVRFQSSFLGNLSRRLLGGAHETITEVSQHANSEALVREFESQSFLHANPWAIFQYVRALVKLDRLDQSQFLLNTLQRGLGMNEQVQPIVEESNITFKDVKGAYYPKKELKEIVEYLRYPESCARLGAMLMLPKGYLLAGPTGTGKTMLARAVAGEARVPFFSCNGREFETYFGDGARRMSNLFASAKKQSPSIIFIDEIDQIYTKRTFDQLLVELDGLKQNDCIFVIAATDAPDSLHMSLLKNGRFDRCVDVLKPNSDEKLQILESLMLKVPKANDVCLDIIAIYTDQFSGADLAKMVNYAALEAARDGAKAVTFSHMMSALDEIRMTKGNPDCYEEE